MCSFTTSNVPRAAIKYVKRKIWGVYEDRDINIRLNCRRKGKDQDCVQPCVGLALVRVLDIQSIGCASTAAQHPTKASISWM